MLKEWVIIALHAQEFLANESYASGFVFHNTQYVPELKLCDIKTHALHELTGLKNSAGDNIPTIKCSKETKHTQTFLSEHVKLLNRYLTDEEALIVLCSVVKHALGG